MSNTSTIHTVELPALGDRPSTWETLGQALDLVRDTDEWWRIRDADGYTIREGNRPANL